MRAVSGHSERLVARARGGDRDARTALVEEHLGLVRSLAFRYRGFGLPLDDLVQEGAVGLLSAIDDFDPHRGASFSTFAFWRVRAAITHALSANGRRTRDRDGGGTPVVELLPDDAASQPDELVIEQARRRALRRAIRRLPVRERAIVRRHFGVDREAETLAAIAAELHLSPERTRALKDEALRELAQAL